jgi:hypothetical protein
MRRTEVSRLRLDKGNQYAGNATDPPSRARSGFRVSNIAICVRPPEWWALR